MATRGARRSPERARRACEGFLEGICAFTAAAARELAPDGWWVEEEHVKALAEGREPEDAAGIGQTRDWIIDFCYASAIVARLVADGAEILSRRSVGEIIDAWQGGFRHGSSSHGTFRKTGIKRRRFRGGCELRLLPPPSSDLEGIFSKGEAWLNARIPDPLERALGASYFFLRNMFVSKNDGALGLLVVDPAAREKPAKQHFKQLRSGSALRGGAFCRLPEGTAQSESPLDQRRYFLCFNVCC